MKPSQDLELLKADRIGYQVMIDRIDQTIAEIEGGSSPVVRVVATSKRVNIAGSAKPKRVVSVAARKRMAAAQKKRWDAARASKKTTSKGKAVAAPEKEA